MTEAHNSDRNRTTAENVYFTKLRDPGCTCRPVQNGDNKESVRLPVVHQMR